MLFAMAGMAVGGWMGGAIFDATLSYRSAFQVALAFNLVEPDAVRRALFLAASATGPRSACPGR